MTSRNPLIDVLRCFGIVLIIISHIQTPHSFHEIICGDVPIMLFCSGLTCLNKTIPDKGRYYAHRLLRLLIPTYLFTTLFYVAFYSLEFFFNGTFKIDWQNVINAYIFDNDSMMGFLWIIKVFILIMFVTPLIVRWKWGGLFNPKYLILTVLIGCVIQTILVYLSTKIQYPLAKTIVWNYILYLTGYSIIFIAGYGISHFQNVTNRMLIISCFLFACVLCSFLAIYGLPFHLLSQKMKYPPNFWYILYGFSMSWMLWCIINRFHNFFSKCKFLIWIGQNTIWLYLWHIICLRIAWHVSSNWLIEILVLFISTVAVYFIQFIIVKSTNNKFLNKYFIG